jgi:hypothetical protein
LLYAVNPTNGAVTPLGSTGYAITGMAQDPTSGILYAVSNHKSPGAPDTLLRLDPANGAATVIGPVGSKAAPQRIADMDFDSNGNLFGWSEEKDVFVSVDKATGLATPIGENDISTYGSASAFDSNDTFWLLGEGEGKPPVNDEGEFWTIDTATGVPTERGRLTPIDENASSVSAASYDCARTTLYALVNNYGEPPANLVTVDLTTGTLTNKGLTQTAADGLAWYCPLEFEFPTTTATVKAGKKTTLTVPVVRGPRVKGAATAAFSTVNGSAKAGKDFTAASGVLGFANNVAGSSIALNVTPDPKAGSNRMFTLTLSGPSGGGSVGAPYTVTIKAGKPQKAKVKGPKSTAATKVTFKLISGQLPSRFRCKLDKGKFKGCGKAGKKAKKFTLKALKPGKHTLTVQVANGAGLKSKPIKKKFTVLP